MGWAFVSVVGFALFTGLVVVLARTNTARWEADHRAAQAAIREREQASRRARVAALIAPRAPQNGHRMPRPRLRRPQVPHPHLPHLPHVHLPARVVDRLPRPLGNGHLLRLDGLPARRLPRLPGRRRLLDEQPQPDPGEPAAGPQS
ncbi:hypothetical protein [Geodermatophilus sabuli]|uniref:Uncharacterized protein n=1 Tax=Geodermatophilus sabuli TaxID=1564158 RepID=A0A285EMH9_9ACTN|nr:hypothetical protein [Geodermatophilus sabuli]MBB3087046.1 hypothetical protein [Geodermatophilus sabuli]SNX99384.1 hypothetical protein SAMN06893097_11835 [Geodermatophilus sabuli]